MKPRSQCHCQCHRNPGVKHCVPCCYPDPKESAADIYFDEISEIVEAHPIIGHRNGGAGDPE